MLFFCSEILYHNRSVATVTMNFTTSPKRPTLLEDASILYLPRPAKSVVRNISEHSQWVLYNNESERRRLIKRWAQMDKDHARQMRLLEADFQEVKHDLRNMELEKKVLHGERYSSRESTRTVSSGPSQGARRGSQRSRRYGRKQNKANSKNYINPKLKDETVSKEFHRADSDLPIIQPKSLGVSSGKTAKQADQIAKLKSNSHEEAQDELTSPTPAPSDVSGKLSITETIYYLSFQARQRYMNNLSVGNRNQDEQPVLPDKVKQLEPGQALPTMEQLSNKPFPDHKKGLWGALRQSVIDGSSKTTKNNTPSWERKDSKLTKTFTPCGECKKCVETMRTRRKNVMQQLYGQGRHSAERMEKRRLVSGSTAGWTAIRSVVIINNALKKSREKERESAIPVS